MNRWDNVGQCEDAVWYMRLVDMPRGDNRAVLDRTYNGLPPETPEEAEEQQNQVNRNFLEGTNILSQARAQWNNAFLKQKNYFTVNVDSGPPVKRQEWSHCITANINRQLKRCRQQMEQVRAEGASVVLHGIAPSMFKDRRCPILSPLPIASLMIPGETTLDFENLEYLAIFREFVPSQLWELTHGPKVDPGWNMDAVKEAWKYAREIIRKDTNASALQYMPERWEDLRKQDIGYLGSDAVPTIDCWDFFFKDDDGAWYRRMFLDWGVGITSTKDRQPESRNTSKEKGGFIYTSGKRKFANSISEVLQCQFGDCSAVAPFKYHSVRSLGWMIWGVVDISNRLHCRFTEQVFMQMLWWFRCASGQEMARVKKAMFENMGVIPAGISMISANERFKPDREFLEMAFSRNQKLMGDNSALFTKGTSDLGDEETATGTMAKIHTLNSLVSGMLTLAYSYSTDKYREQARRFCIKHSPYKMVSDFQLACLKDGVPPEMLDVDRWDIEPDRALGDGNKMLSMAMVQFLQGIRKNLAPDSQRMVDHISLVSVLDQPRLAEELAPVENQKKLSPGTHDAQLASDRILRGLPFTASPEMVPEDYVTAWLADLAILIQQMQQTGPDRDKLMGLANLAKHIQEFLSLMASGEKEKSPRDEVKGKVMQYTKALNTLTKYIKMLAQQVKPQQQNGGAEMAKVQLEQLKGQTKIRNLVQSHAVRTAQKAAAWELDQQRQDKTTQAEIQRENARTAQELTHNALKSLQE